MLAEQNLSVESIKQAILDNLALALARQPRYATQRDWYTAVALTVRSLLATYWYAGTNVRTEDPVRVVAYLSAEFLLGPHLHNNLVGLGIYSQVERAVTELGQDLGDLIWQEQEPGLGNGGLGRLAACYMESMGNRAAGKCIPGAIRRERGVIHRRLGIGARPLASRPDSSRRRPRHANPRLSGAVGESAALV